MRGPNHYRSLDDQQRHPWTAPEEDRSGQMRREDLKLPENQPTAARDENRSNAEAVDWERAEAANQKKLDAKVNAREITQSERVYLEKRFDNEQLTKTREQEHLAQAREAAAEARQRETEREREQSRER